MRDKNLIYNLSLAADRNKRRQQKKPKALANMLANDAIFLLCNALKIEAKGIGYLGSQGRELELKISPLKCFPGGASTHVSPTLRPLLLLLFIPPSIVSFPWLPSAMTNLTLRHNTFCQPASTSPHVPAEPPSSFLSSPPLSSQKFCISSFILSVSPADPSIHPSIFTSFHFICMPPPPLSSTQPLCRPICLWHRSHPPSSSLPLPSYPSFQHLSSCSLSNMWPSFPIFRMFQQILSPSDLLIICKCVDVRSSLCTTSYTPWLSGAV